MGYRIRLRGPFLAEVAVSPLLVAPSGTDLRLAALVRPLGIGQHDRNASTPLVDDVDAAVVLGDVKSTVEHAGTIGRTLHATLVDDQISVLGAERLARGEDVAGLVLVHLATQVVDHAGKRPEEPLLVGRATSALGLLLLRGAVAAILATVLHGHVSSRGVGGRFLDHSSSQSIGSNAASFIQQGRSLFWRT